MITINTLKWSEFVGVAIIALLIIITQSFQPGSIELLRYESISVNQGEWWRLISANFTHANWNHVWLNLLGLILIDYIFQPFVNQKVRLTALSFCIFTNLMLLHLFMTLDWYVGLSGALHGFLITCLLIAAKPLKPYAHLFIVLIAGKLFIEMNWEVNDVTAGMIETNVVEEAHLAGSISGLIFYLLYFSWLKLLKNKTSHQI
ncbi:MAG: rhombosortase [Gammaproteobacteria bacterium]|nr:rhombosortase [Gammaproteobacteria bacterium]